MTELEQLRIENSHLLRRLAQRAPEFSQSRHTAQVMSAKERMVKAQLERDRALRENGELRARLAVLEQVVVDLRNQLLQPYPEQHILLQLEQEVHLTLILVINQVMMEVYLQ